MNRTARVEYCLVAMLAIATSATPAPQRNEDLLRELQQVHDLNGESMRRIREVFAGSPVIGQGNPAVTEHPATPEACVAKLRDAGVSYEDAESDRICGARYMAPLYDPSREKAQDARACIDRFEFPNIPCAYPVVWVRAHEAAQLCEAEGKRLCDAHEWEGACAGSLEQPDYRFDLAKGRAPVAAVSAMRAAQIALMRRANPGATAPPIRRVSARRRVGRLRAAKADSGPVAGRTPSPRASFPRATARQASSTSTATLPST